MAAVCLCVCKNRRQKFVDGGWQVRWLLSKWRHQHVTMTSSINNRSWHPQVNTVQDGPKTASFFHCNDFCLHSTNFHNMLAHIYCRKFAPPTCAKNYRNWLRVDKVIAMKNGCSFFGSPCVCFMAHLSFAKDYTQIIYLYKYGDVHNF